MPGENETAVPSAASAAAGGDALPCTAESLAYLLARLAPLPDEELDRLLAGATAPGLPGGGFGGTAAAFRTRARQLRASADAFEGTAARLLAALHRAGR